MSRVLPKMIDMARSQKEIKNDYPMAYPSSCGEPIYSYGLCLSLGKDELEKIDLDEDVEVDDMIKITALCKVTSVSKNSTTSGDNIRVELQITHIEELEDDDEKPAERRSFYKK